MIHRLIWLLIVASRVISIPDEEIQLSSELYVAGNALLKAGNVDQAIMNYRQSISILASAAAYSNLGNALQSKHEFEEALEAYQSAVALEPNKARTYYNIGVCYYSLQKLQQAIQSFQSALQIDPSHLNSLYNLGICYQELGDLQQAGIAYSQVLALNSYHAEARLNYCNILATFQDTSASETCYLGLLTLHPSFLPGLLSLAGFYHRSQDESIQQQAIPLYQQILSIKPNNAMARHGLASLDSSTLFPVDKEEHVQPSEYVKELFDSYSSHFDASLASLQYKAPSILYNAVQSTLITSSSSYIPINKTLEERDASVSLEASEGEVVEEDGLRRKKYRILDLGAGTGLACTAFHSLANFIVGVDLSSKMLSKASQLGCYNETIVAEVTQFVKGYEGPLFDIIIAADVLVYMPELEELFFACEKVLENGGLFAFTIESLIENKEDGHEKKKSEETIDKAAKKVDEDPNKLERYRGEGSEVQEGNEDTERKGRRSVKLLSTGRYAHAADYVRVTAESSGFEIRLEEACVPRMDRGSPISGRVFVLQKIINGRREMIGS